MNTLRPSDVTPNPVYLSCRRFLAASLAAPVASAAKLSSVRTAYVAAGEKVTSYQIPTGYNNFYEFGTGKDEPVKRARNFRASPWTVTIEGQVARARTLDLDAILKLAPLEERIYRHRCVEGWSIVVPWIGFPLSALLKQVEPTGNARYVAFESYYDSRQMLSHWSAGIQRFGQGAARDTLMFNGYPEVAGLYTGMNLIKYY